MDTNCNFLLCLDAVRTSAASEESECEKQAYAYTLSYIIVLLNNNALNAA